MYIWQFIVGLFLYNLYFLAMIWLSAHLSAPGPFPLVLQHHHGPGTGSGHSRGSLQTPKVVGPTRLFGGIHIGKTSPSWVKYTHTPIFFSFGTPKFMEVWMVQMIFRISIGMIFGFQPLLFRGVHCEKNHSNRFWRFFVVEWKFLWVFVSWKNRKEKYEEHTNSPHMFV